MCIRDRGCPATSASNAPSWPCARSFSKRACTTVSYTHLRAHETDSYLVFRLLLVKRRRKLRSILPSSSAASDVYKRQGMPSDQRLERAKLAMRQVVLEARMYHCLLYTSPSPRDGLLPRIPSSACKETAKTEINTTLFVGSVRCV